MRPLEAGENHRAGAPEVFTKTTPNSLAVRLITEQLPGIKNLPDWRERILPEIVDLASYLDPLPLGELTQAVKDHLGINTGGFRESAKQAAKDRRAKTDEKLRQQGAAPPRE